MFYAFSLLICSSYSYVFNPSILMICPSKPMLNPSILVLWSDMQLRQ